MRRPASTSASRRQADRRLDRDAASEITLKLVRNAGGEAIADTSWIVQSDSGEKLAERVGAFTTLVLAGGNYNVIARNRDRFYTEQISVEPGKRAEIEVVANPSSEAEKQRIPAGADRLKHVTRRIGRRKAPIARRSAVGQLAHPTPAPSGRSTS